MTCKYTENILYTENIFEGKSWSVALRRLHLSQSHDWEKLNPHLSLNGWDGGWKRNFFKQSF